MAWTSTEPAPPASTPQVAAAAALWLQKHRHEFPQRNGTNGKNRRQYTTPCSKPPIVAGKPGLTRISAAGFYAQTKPLTSATRRSRRRGGQKDGSTPRTSHLAVSGSNPHPTTTSTVRAASLVFWDCTQFGTSMRPTARNSSSSLTRKNHARVKKVAKFTA